MMSAINHIFNDNNQQSPLAALHELTHRAKEEEEEDEIGMPEMPEMTHDHFMPPMEMEVPRAMEAIQQMIQHMVRPMFEPREVRPAPSLSPSQSTLTT